MEPLFIFLILLLGLLVVSFLMNRTTTEGFDSLTDVSTLPPDTYIGIHPMNKAITVSVTANTDGTYTFIQNDVNNNRSQTYYGGDNISKEEQNKILADLQDLRVEMNAPTTNMRFPNSYSGKNGTISFLNYYGKTYVKAPNLDYFALMSPTKVTSGSGTKTTGADNKNQDNYNHFTRTSTPTVFYGPNGATAKVSMQNGIACVIITDNMGNTTVYYINGTKGSSANQNSTIYYGPNGSIATLYTNSRGDHVLAVNQSNGSTIIYSSNNQQTFNPSIDNPPIPQTNSGKAEYISGQEGNSTAYLIGPSGNTGIGLRAGIPRRMIPPGDEDLYILKTEIVPPVCPVCPPQIVTYPKGGDSNPPPPCPPCARCPEPNFDCKKVPNYNSGNSGSYYFGSGSGTDNGSNMGGFGAGNGSNMGGFGGNGMGGIDGNSRNVPGRYSTGVNNDSLPVPVLSNYSSFGM